MSYATELHTAIEFKGYSNTLTVNCPDEDDDMAIIVKKGTWGYYAKAVYSLNLDEAQELAEFLIEHVKNARKP